jgi:hypothetical protein
MSYEAIENSIRERLHDKMPEGIVSKIMEETESEVERPRTAPTITVCFYSSDFYESKSTAEISQDDTITFLLMLTSRKRRGVKGIYDMFGHCKKALLGWTPSGCLQKIQFKQFKIELNEQGEFTYALYFETKAVIVEDSSDYDLEQSLLPLASEINFEPEI